MTDAENEVENEDINVMTVTNHVLLQGLISGIEAGVDNNFRANQPLTYLKIQGVHKCPDLSPSGIT